jgi:hypothetical protein
MLARNLYFCSIRKYKIKNLMKKFLTLLVAAALSTVALAQTTVTFTVMVDVTNYVAGGATIANNGIRVGGTFGALGATSNGTPMLDWNPTDAGSAMTDMGNNVWSKSITFPATAVGQPLLFKFVNGTWGTPDPLVGDNEGRNADTLILSQGCGVADGSNPPNINRSVIILPVPLTVKYCWNRCFQCDGSSPIIISSTRSLTQSIKPLTVYPNPFNGEMNISYENARSSKVSVEIVNLLGQSVKTLFNGQQAAGPYEMVWDATATNGSKVPFGTYFVRQVVDGKTSVKKVIYNR